MSNAAKSFLDGKADRPSGGRRMLDFARTIRGRVFLSFFVLGLVTFAVGSLSAFAIRDSKQRSRHSMTLNAQAVATEHLIAADFSALKSAKVEREAAVAIGNEAERERLDRVIDRLRATLNSHLTQAGSAEPVLVQPLDEIRNALASWDRDLKVSEARRSEDLAEKEAEVRRIVLTLGRGTIEQHAGAAWLGPDVVGTDLVVTLGGTALALLAIALAGSFLTRQIIRPFATASAIADGIANGRLDIAIPELGNDEFGTLMSSMRTMRGNMKSVMDREVTLRRSAQTRLADALDGSQDGIIVVDADLRVALANPQAADFLGAAPSMLAPGTPVFAMAGAAPSSKRLLLDLLGLKDTAEESRLADGRWLRISRSATREGGFIALCSDISVQKDQEAKLQATNLRLDAALENMSQGLCLYGADETLLVVNRRFCEIFSLPVELIESGMTLRTVVDALIGAGHFPGRNAHDVFEAEHRVFQQRKSSQRFLEIGGRRIVGVAIQPLSDGGWLSTFEDVTERRQAEERIAFMARHDALTLLPNRVLFAERVDAAAERAGLGHKSAILCLDLDQFKHVNDTLGHPVGDELLRAVSTRLRDCVRSIDTVARLGGDEFAIVQPDISDPQESVALAKRIIERLSAPFNLEGGHLVRIGVSIGISITPGDGLDHGKLLKNADVALYRAKEDGRGTFRFFEAEMDSRLQSRRALEMDLRRAIDENQFEVWYQPQFDLRADRIVGFEALLRWRHPVTGMVGPGEFIPLAEEIGLIREIGAWVLKTACSEATRWPENLRIAVNVSPVQLRYTDFSSVVAEAIAHSGLDVGRLELEITESVMLSSSSSALDLLHEVRKLGVQVSIDDFGTGYSSLTSLRSFPFTKIKIDKSFVQDLSNNAGAQAVIRAVIVLGTGLEMRTTAEGVETAEQMARLRIEGCSEVQGYLISPPKPAGEVLGLLERWNGVSRRPRVVAVA